MQNQVQLTERVLSQTNIPAVAIGSCRAIGQIQLFDSSMINRWDIHNSGRGTFLHQFREQVRQQEVTHVVGAYGHVIALFCSPWRYHTWKHEKTSTLWCGCGLCFLCRGFDYCQTCSRQKMKGQFELSGSIFSAPGIQMNLFHRKWTEQHLLRCDADGKLLCFNPEGQWLFFQLAPKLSWYRSLCCRLSQDKI